MTLQETIISGLTIMSVSGLTWLAYHHHDAYMKISDRIMRFINLVVFCSVSYEVGIMYSRGAMFSVVPSSDIQQKIDVAIKTIRLPQITIFIVCFAAICYLGFLNFLPYIIKDRPQKP